MKRSTSPLAAALLAAVVGSVLSPTVAAAADSPDSGYNVGCTLHPDQGQESSADPAGIGFDGERNDIAVSPQSRRISAVSESVYPEAAATTGEDCGVSGDFSDRLVVGPGTSGLAAGDRVPVEVTVHLDVELTEVWDGDGAFQVRARYSAGASITSLDDCTEVEEGRSCDQPLSFGADDEHYLYGGPQQLPWYPQGYVEAQARESHHFETNTGVAVEHFRDHGRPGGEDDTLLCDSWPCAAESALLHPDGQAPLEFTGAAELVVGSRYDLSGSLNLFTQAYDDVGTRGVAAVDDFSFTITPAAGYEGVALDYASAGGTPADTTAPQVQVDVTPAAPGGWHTTPPTVRLSALDESGPAALTFGATGAVEIPETVVEESVLGHGVTEVLVDVDGLTEISYRATDPAGNVSEPQTLVVRLDRAAPTLSGLAAVTVAATSSAGATVSYGVGAVDAVDGSPLVACTPPSAGTFPIGVTTVQCSATDDAGNRATGSFTVTVTAPAPSADPMGRLGQAIGAANVRFEIRQGLLVAHRAIELLIDTGQRKSVVCGSLGTLNVLVTLLRTWSLIPSRDAVAISSAIRDVRASIRC
ncbi:hypothetical protein GCM10010531_42740 [Blastococcus jejuensis]|uniref:HYR domain-containing protein n=1 Tax=Blastococcus jejuensis TaxID=351224 RepID=A0ABP6PMU9_9ACTN